jgi:tetratricopeptide (TPR) repeat protein
MRPLALAIALLIPAIGAAEQRCARVSAERWPGDEYRLEIVLHPVHYGPRITHPPDLARATAEVFSAVVDRFDELRACYRWARFRERRLDQVDLPVTIAVDSFGQATAVRATAPYPEAAALVTCLSDVLTGQRMGEYQPRTAEVTIPLRFEPSIQGRPPVAPRRPRARRPELQSTLCTENGGPLPHDVTTHQRDVLVVTDWDPEQQRREAEAQHRGALAEWRRSRVGPAPERTPDVIYARDQVRGRARQEELEGALLGNLGAYRACLEEAVGRQAVLPAGLLRLQGSLDRTGQLRWTAARDGDEAMGLCLVRALEQVRIWPGLRARRARVELTFQINPRPPARPTLGASDAVPAVEAAARALLALEDGAEALRAFDELLRRAPGDPRACLWHVGRVEATAVAAAWSDQPAVDEAISRLQRFVAGQPPPITLPCLVVAAPIVRRLVERQRMLGHHLYAPSLLARAEGRFRQLLDFHPPLPNHFWLRASLAAMLQRSDRWGDAAVELTGLLEEWPSYWKDVEAYRQTGRDALVTLVKALDADEGSPRLPDIEHHPGQARETLCALGARVLRHPSAKADDLAWRASQLRATCRL